MGKKKIIPPGVGTSCSNPPKKPPDGMDARWRESGNKAFSIMGEHNLKSISKPPWIFKTSCFLFFNGK